MDPFWHNFLSVLQSLCWVIFNRILNLLTGLRGPGGGDHGGAAHDAVQRKEGRLVLHPAQELLQPHQPEGARGRTLAHPGKSGEFFWRFFFSNLYLDRPYSSSTTAPSPPSTPPASRGGTRRRHMAGLPARRRRNLSRWPKCVRNMTRIWLSARIGTRNEVVEFCTSWVHASGSNPVGSRPCMMLVVFEFRSVFSLLCSISCVWIFRKLWECKLGTVELVQWPSY